METGPSLDATMNTQACSRQEIAARVPQGPAEPPESPPPQVRRLNEGQERGFYRGAPIGARERYFCRAREERHDEPRIVIEIVKSTVDRGSRGSRW
jgi:hypothetical protein